MDSMLMMSLDNMKSSRRKQSKPIRVSYREGGVQSSPSLPPEFPQRESSVEASEEELENDEEMPSQEYEINSCDKCPETFPTPEALTAHVSNFHCSDEVKPMSYSFPTKYHQLGNEFSKESGFINERGDSKMPIHDANRNNVACPIRYSPDERTFRDLPNGDVQRPSEDKSGMSYDDAVDMNANDDNSFKCDGTRIFHRDAYCELCDREFCNKYFLKTHKANKHAIYDGSFPLVGMSMPHSPDNIGTSGITVSPGVPTSAAHVFASTSPIASLSSSVGSNLFADSPNKGASKSGDSDMPPLLPAIPMLSTPPKSDTTTTTPSVPTMTPSEMEDYCEICQKHFCNKYYLKRHKQDVHGIAPETPSMSRRRPVVDSLPSMVPTTTSSSLLMPQSMNNLNNVMVLNPFVPPVAILQAPPFLQSPFTSPPGMSIIPHSLPMSSLPMTSLPMTSLPMTSLPMTSLPMTSLPMTSLPMTTLPASTQSEQPVAIAMAPSPGTIPNDSLRNMGVLNAEAYCELCRKEFCNKYFLKIHKANKHGIFTDDMQVPMFMNNSVHPPGLPDNFYRYSGTTDPAQALVESIFRATSKLESANAELHNQRHNKSVGNSETNSFCNICNSEFSSKYSYKIHKMSVHGILTDDHLGEDKLEPGQVTVSSSSQFVESGNSPQSKNNDPIKCEVCYRQLNGKQAFKNHMAKYHGVNIDVDIKPDISRIKSERNESSSVEAESNKDSQTDKGEVDKAQEKDLVKFGVNPEAYCEICNKEFCSKFFYRTHMLNIHGLKSPKMNGDHQQKSPGSPVPSSAVGTLQRLAEANALNLTSSSPLNLSNNTMDYESSEKTTWRWKEPANSSRVTCDICNRELCNKYFLKTHKFNKHGIPFENQKVNSNNDLSNKANGTGANSKNATKSPSNVVKDERRSQTIQKLSESLKIKSYEDDSSNYTDVCNFCNKRFSSTASLQSHLIKEHALLQTPSYSIDRMLYASLPPSNFDFKLTTKEGSLCNLCKKTFVDTLALQLHLIQEHNAQVQLQPEIPPQGLDLSNHTIKDKIKSKLKLYSCSHCDYKSKWLPNIYSHEEKKHNITKASRSTFQCSMCTKTFLYEHSLIRHMRDYHQQNKHITPDLHNKTADVKNFKCTRCKSNFPTLFECIKHIRHDHIRRDKNSNQKSTPPRTLLCHKCSFTTRFPRMMRNHKLRYHIPRKAILDRKSPLNSESAGSNGPVCHASALQNYTNYEMQSFTLQADKQETFVQSTVNLPVRAMVKSPVTVTFTLTPMEH